MADSPPPALSSSISLRCPSKYQAEPSTLSVTLEHLLRTWTVTHSTLSMWRSARNVRITYTALPAGADGRVRVDDLVEYESNSGPPGTADKPAKVKSVAGVDTQAAAPDAPAGAASEDLSSWNWRGKGWLFFVHSHWELLGLGERTRADGRTERWAVTWFQKTVFSQEGLDIYCDLPEGISAETAEALMEALKGVHPKIAEMVGKDMRAVEVAVP